MYEDKTHRELVVYEGRRICQIIGWISLQNVFDETDFVDLIPPNGIH